ncbi:monooxygenase [Rummeliibacillus sp. NPDC094406]|uniref:monooxygenase n=1 Tax=Rummeliibacillus sp. NPDC094406 TaxID=3364511 RepID=UPI00381F2459
MAYILQEDFKMNGPFREQMAKEFEGLARSINDEEGTVWKIWTENTDTKEAGGIYLFDKKNNAEKYLEMHSKRLSSFGITQIRGKIFEINKTLTNINNGPINVLEK